VLPLPQSTVADADKPPEIFCDRFQAHLPICPLHNPQHAPKYDVVPSPFLANNYSYLTTPRQYFLESSFPSTYASPSKSAIDAASKSNEAELDREEKTHEITEERLSIRNLIIKVILDQTISASVNTLMFSLAFAGFNRMGYADAWGEARSQYWGLMLAGWKLWPLVSLVGFSVVKSVEGRNLLGSLAGLGWGIYLSLTMGGQTEVKEL